MNKTVYPLLSDYEEFRQYIEESSTLVAKASAAEVKKMPAYSLREKET
ncbi:hypothetical protein [Legionella birminghamensis]|uniref:Uncharacterized protein n=1 Tax=Legionella birminghamensis TaxID=28083 RepID=A0A378I873_9GAMM|nr:hypothetical protein [Legionella birminghamensis]STX30920.1 Uncharacterised protein [Legionella birminghamensis]